MTKTTNNLITFYEGTLPIILSAPHGGEVEPSYIKNRQNGVFDKDDFTIELTELIVKEFYLQTKQKPYVVISNLARIKVDMNREEKEAYDDKNAKYSYLEFHKNISNSKQKIEKEFKKGIFIDIHGQSHPNAYLEFGYLLDNTILQSTNLNIQKYQNKSSISSLSKFSKNSFLEQIKGEHSMGSLLTREGYDSIPSFKHPYANDNNYFEGAYNTISYGSLKGGNIIGIQIEFPYLKCRDTKENREKCAKTFVEALIKFMKIHLEINLNS